jgi:hypothetical protein
MFRVQGEQTGIMSATVSQAIWYRYHDADEQQKGPKPARLLALICAERTRQAGRFQSSSAPRVLLSAQPEDRELEP